jgi:hypothetical protein
MAFAYGVMNIKSLWVFPFTMGAEEIKLWSKIMSDAELRDRLDTEALEAHQKLDALMQNVSIAMELYYELSKIGVVVSDGEHHAMTVMPLVALEEEPDYLEGVADLLASRLGNQRYLRHK